MKISSSRFSIVDLAVCENSKQTQNTPERQQEGKSINQGLQNLRRCFEAIASRAKAEAGRKSIGALTAN